MGRGQSFHDNNVYKKIIGDTNVCSRVHDHKSNICSDSSVVSFALAALR
jgi:hypothetical protein